MKFFALPIALISLTAGSPDFALAACTGPAGVVPISEFAPLESIVQSARFSDLSVALAPAITIPPEALEPLERVYDEPFESCSIILQRRDVGGMVQQVEVYNGPQGMLFAIWTGAELDGKFSLMTFNVNTSVDFILGQLH